MRSLRALAVPLLAVALAAPALALPPTTTCAANVPCGYIYPLILIGLGDDVKQPMDLAAGEALELDATLTFKFDAVNEGFTLNEPGQPIIVSFEYPRKPSWVNLAVDPPQLEIPINPIYIQPDASDPGNLQGEYVYETPIRITAELTDQPVLQDGFDFAKLLIFAKSTESGLYKSGYGIKELRVIPEGAVHESDVAGNADTFEVVDLAPVKLPASTRSLPGGLDVTVTPPDEVMPWRVGRWTVEANQPSTLHVTFTDEAGNLVYASGPRTVMGGATTLNVTLPGPGRVTAGVTALPLGDGAFLPATTSHAFDVGPLGAEGVRYPREYQASYTEGLTEVHGNLQEPGFQYEKRIPLPILPGATGAKVTLALDTKGLPANAGTAPANLQVSLLDPQGAVVMQGSVDAANPARVYHQGALPGDGTFELVLQGVGAPLEANSYTLGVDVKYDGQPEVRTDLDGVPDPVTVGRFGAFNVTLDLPLTPEPFERLELAPVLEQDGMARTPATAWAFTVTNGTGDLVYASGLRNAGAAFVPPGPGVYVIHAFATPRLAEDLLRGSERGTGFQAMSLAFAVRVGDEDATAYRPPATVSVVDEVQVPASTSLRNVAVLPVPVLPGAGAFEVTADLANAAGGSLRLLLVDANGEAVAEKAAGGSVVLDASGLEPGLHLLLVEAASPTGSALALDGGVDLLNAASVPNPFAASEGGGVKGDLRIPMAWVAAALALGLATGIVVLTRRP